MRLSCCAYSYRDALRAGSMDLSNFIRLCRAIGCEAAELTSYYFASTDGGYLNDLKRLAHREGVLISGTAMANDFTQPDAGLRAEQVRVAREWIERTAVLGAPTIRVTAGYLREGQDPEDARPLVAAALRECAEAAWDLGVQLALENHAGLTDTAAKCLQMVQMVDHPALRLNLDAGNFTCHPYEQIAESAPYAVAVHAKPRAYSDPPDTWVDLDYRRVFRTLEDAGYKGFVAVEYEEAEPAESGVPAFVAQLRAALEG